MEYDYPYMEVEPNLNQTVYFLWYSFVLLLSFSESAKIRVCTRVHTSNTAIEKIGGVKSIVMSRLVIERCYLRKGDIDKENSYLNLQTKDTVFDKLTLFCDSGSFYLP